MNRLCRSLLLTLTLTAAAWVPALAQTFGHSLEAYKSGDFATAFAGFNKLADKGHADSQYNLGLMYRRGHGVLQDNQQAVDWYRKAAKQGDASAQSNLGLMYSNGTSVTQDFWTAVDWYRLELHRYVDDSARSARAIFVNRGSGQG